MWSLSSSLHVVVALGRAFQHRVECTGAVNIATPDHKEHVLYHDIIINGTPNGRPIVRDAIRLITNSLCCL